MIIYGYAEVICESHRPVFYLMFKFDLLTNWLCDYVHIQVFDQSSVQNDTNIEKFYSPCMTIRTFEILLGVFKVYQNFVSR